MMSLYGIAGDEWSVLAVVLIGEQTVDNGEEVVYNEGVSTDYARAANSRAALTNETLRGGCDG